MPQELTQKQQQAQNERTQAKVGLASNALGITAGSAALAAALKDKSLYRRSHKLGHQYEKPPVEPRKIGGPVTGRIAGKMKSRTAKGRVIRAGLAGMAGLQLANLGGDLVANRVLARSAAEKPKKSGASITKAYESPRVDIGYGVSLDRAVSKRAYYDDYEREFDRQRAAGRNQALLVGSGAATAAAAPLLYRSAYKKPERKAIRSARSAALKRSKGRIAGAGLLLAGGAGLTGAAFANQKERRTRWE